MAYLAHENGVNVRLAMRYLRGRMSKASPLSVWRMSIWYDNHQWCVDPKGAMIFAFSKVLRNPNHKKIELPCRCDIEAVASLRAVYNKAEDTFEDYIKLLRPDVYAIENFIQRGKESMAASQLYNRYSFTADGPYVDTNQLITALKILPEADIIGVRDKKNELHTGIKLCDKYGNHALLLGIGITEKMPPTDLSVSFEDLMAEQELEYDLPF